MSKDSGVVRDKIHGAIQRDPKIEHLSLTREYYLVFHYDRENKAKNIAGYTVEESQNLLTLLGIHFGGF